MSHEASGYSGTEGPTRRVSSCRPPRRDDCGPRSRDTRRADRASSRVASPSWENAAALPTAGHWRSSKVWGSGRRVAAADSRATMRMPGSPTPLDAAGNRLNNAPEWSGGGSAVYVHAAGGRGTVMLRGDVTWQSRVFFEPFNDDIETQPKYG